MVEQTAKEYAKILQSADLDKEINPLCTNIEDMLARLDEFETVLSSVRAETNGIMANHVCNILSFNKNFEELCQRIDNLEHFVTTVNENLDKVENSVDVAEQELNVTDYSIHGLLLKPLKAKLSAADTSGMPLKTNLTTEGEFQTVSIFKSDEYFGIGASETKGSETV